MALHAPSRDGAAPVSAAAEAAGVVAAAAVGGGAQTDREMELLAAALKVGVYYGCTRGVFRV